MFQTTNQFCFRVNFKSSGALSHWRTDGFPSSAWSAGPWRAFGEASETLAQRPGPEQSDPDFFWTAVVLRIFFMEIQNHENCMKSMPMKYGYHFPIWESTCFMGIHKKTIWEKDGKGWLVDWLVVKQNHLEKWWSESQWVSDDIPYMTWKIIQPCSSHHQPVIINHHILIN